MNQEKTKKKKQPSHSGGKRLINIWKMSTHVVTIIEINTKLDHNTS